MRFLGMAGYYRKFCKNFSSIAEPLTNLLKKSTKFKWNDECQDAFDRLKAILKSAQVLLTPDFDKCFKLAVDAGDFGIGAIYIYINDIKKKKKIYFINLSFSFQGGKCYVHTQFYLALYMCVFILNGFPVAIFRTGFPFVEYCSGSFRPCLQSDY